MDRTRIMPAAITAAAHQLATLMLPHQCVLCRQFADTTSLCASCWGGLTPIAAPLCARCGLPLGHTLADPLCAGCWTKPPPLTAIRACFHYADSARELILHFKHGDGLQLTPLLARLGARLFIELCHDNSFVIPVPLHRRRYFRRRYNQAAEWARQLCHHTGTGAFAPDLLIRRRATRSQGGLSRHQRQRNIAGAFAVPPDARPRLADRPVLLIDDVLTTGATLHEAARRLTAAGSGPVSALVLARVTRLSHA
ncbi:MAG: ComF family protein [Candidatus Puniceispirillaceae bacterium]